MQVDDVDIDEVQCILANLIYLGHIKGYISHQHQKLVVSKQNPFPPLSTVCCWILHLSHASTLQILSLPSGTAPSDPRNTVNGLVHVQDWNTRNCSWLLSQNGQGCQGYKVHWNEMLTLKWLFPQAFYIIQSISWRNKAKHSKFLPNYLKAFIKYFMLLFLCLSFREMYQPLLLVLIHSTEWK